MRKTTENRIRKVRMANKGKGKGKKVTGRRMDPLKTFKAKSRT
jgi:ATP-dependent RNA helicase DDX56/DBP9